MLIKRRNFSEKKTVIFNEIYYVKNQMNTRSNADVICPDSSYVSEGAICLIFK